MSVRSRPLWFEGQLVRPQHLQQSQRWTEALVEDRLQSVFPRAWGLHTLRLDPAMLALGKIAIEACRAVLPDGTVVDAPAAAPSIEPLTVPPGTGGRVVKLALKARAGDGLEVGDTSHRFLSQTQDVRNATGSGISAQIMVGLPNVRLVLDGEPENEFVTLPIARVVRLDASGAVLLDSDFVPPALRLGAHPGFLAVAREIEGMLAGRGTMLAQRIDPSRTTSDLAGMVDFMLLTVINTHEPTFHALANDELAAPYDLYREALRLAGALSTFGRQGRRPPAMPAWRHEDPGPPLAHLVRIIREVLAALSVDTAIALPLQLRGQGAWVSPITDRTLLTGATFILAVRAASDPERLRATFPAQAKIGPAELIVDLVKLQLPGIPLRPAPVAPREIPYRTGTVYFELDRNADMWRQLQTSPAFVIHSGADIPGLALEFWAIRRD